MLQGNPCLVRSTIRGRLYDEGPTAGPELVGDLSHRSQVGAHALQSLPLFYLCDHPLDDRFNGNGLSVADSVNTNEQVQVATPAVGTWTVSSDSTPFVVSSEDLIDPICPTYINNNHHMSRCKSRPTPCQSRASSHFPSSSRPQGRCVDDNFTLL